MLTAAMALLCLVVLATAWRSMAAFTCLVLVVRPLLDLAAQERGSAVGLTQLFGVAVLATCVGWLALNADLVATRLRSRLSWALLAVLVCLGLSTLGSASVGNSAALVLRVATGVALFFVVDALLAGGVLHWRRLVGALAAATVVPLTYPLAGLVGAPVTHEKDDVEALRSVFYLSNNFAHWLVPFVLVGLAATFYLHGSRRWAVVVVTAVASTQLLLTQTRGAWAAALVGALLVALWVDRRLVLVLAAGLVLADALVPGVHERVLTVLPSADAPRQESSLTWRLGHWLELLPMFRQSPLLGVGPDEANRLSGKEPHNDLLRFLVEGGVVGFAAYAWLLLECVLLGLVALRVVRSQRRLGVPDPDQGLRTAVVVGTAAYFAAFPVASLGENLVDNVTMLFVLMPALALLRHASEQPEQPVRAPVPEPSGVARG